MRCVIFLLVCIHFCLVFASKDSETRPGAVSSRKRRVPERRRKVPTPREKSIVPREEFAINTQEFEDFYMEFEDANCVVIKVFESGNVLLLIPMSGEITDRFELKKFYLNNFYFPDRQERAKVEEYQKPALPTIEENEAPVLATVEDNKKRTLVENEKPALATVEDNETPVEANEKFVLPTVEEEPDTFVDDNDTDSITNETVESSEMDEVSVADTLPELDNDSDTTEVEHVADISKLEFDFKIRKAKSVDFSKIIKSMKIWQWNSNKGKDEQR